MEAGRSYDDALAEAQRLGYAEADPTEDVAGLDAAAKKAILATVAFGSRIALEGSRSNGIQDVTLEHVTAAHALGMAVQLIGRATLVDDAVDVRVGPAFVDRHHSLAAVEGAFNAVMLQGDAIREITLEGPGAGGLETASAVVADMVFVVGTTGTGFLQNDAGWRELERLPPGDLASPSTSGWRSRTGPACWRISRTSSRPRGSRSRSSCSSHTTATPRSTSSPTRPRRASSTPRWPRSARCPRRGARRAPCPWSPAAASPSWAGRDDPADRGASASRLPVSERTPVISLGEGSTPLLPARRLSELLGVEILLKWEASNPTGSYKDRGMTVAVSKAAEDSAEAIICASTRKWGSMYMPIPAARSLPGTVTNVQ